MSELTLTKMEELEADIDLRLISVDLIDVLGVIEEGEIRNTVIKLVRIAYGLGYCDAWSEERVASLYTDHGFKLPNRALGVWPG